MWQHLQLEGRARVALPSTIHFIRPFVSCARQPVTRSQSSSSSPPVTPQVYKPIASAFFKNPKILPPSSTPLLGDLISRTLRFDHHTTIEMAVAFFTGSIICLPLFFLLLLQSPAACTASGRHLSVLVKDPPLVLDYHDGALLAGPGSLNVYTIWYGDFASESKAVVSDFFTSFNGIASAAPSVSSWWKITQGYKDSSGSSIFGTVKLAAQLSYETASLGKSLKSADLQSLLSKALSSSALPQDPKALYLILTAKDIAVEGFCVQSCASHRVLNASSSQQLVYAWIGDSSTQCAGKCAWPYANPKDFGGPDTAPLVAPNGVGVDGMIINIATMVAGATSNPFGTGYFQGPSSAPLEAVTACPGIFGQGAYSGYPGRLLDDGASFNAHGSNDRRFLLPALWNPSTQSCAYPST